MFNYFRIVLLLLFTVVATGCYRPPTFVSHSYQLGSKPTSARTMIDEIVEDEIGRHYMLAYDERLKNKKWTPVTVVESENTVIVETTSRGHRQIRAALRKLD